MGGSYHTHNNTAGAVAAQQPLALQYAAGAPPPSPQLEPLPYTIPPFLTLTPELLAQVASYLEGGYALRTLPLVAAPLADNVDVLIGQGVHALLLHARNLPLLERLAPQLHSLTALVLQGCRPLRCLGLATPEMPRDDELLARLERVLAARPPLAVTLRHLACDDLSLEDEAAAARVGRILARLPRVATLALAHAEITDGGMAQMIEALLAGAPPGEEAAAEAAGVGGGYSVSCTTSLRVLDLEDNTLEDPSTVESLLAVFPSLKHLALHANLLPPLPLDATLRRLAPHLLLNPPTNPTTTILLDHAHQRRHPLLPLSLSRVTSPASSAGGIDHEEEDDENENEDDMAMVAASPLPRTNPTTTTTTTTKPLASPCYTPSPATAYTVGGRRGLPPSTGPTTPTRAGRPSSPSVFTAASSSSSGPPPPGPASTHPRRPVSYAERLMLLPDTTTSTTITMKTPGIAPMSPLARAMEEEGEDEGVVEGARDLLGLGMTSMDDEGEGDVDDDGMPLSPLPKRARRGDKGGEGAGKGGTHLSFGDGV